MNNYFEWNGSLRNNGYAKKKSIELLMDMDIHPQPDSDELDK